MPSKESIVCLLVVQVVSVVLATTTFGPSTSTGSTSTGTLTSTQGSSTTGSSSTWSASTGSTGTWSTSTGSTSTGMTSTGSTGTWSPSTGSTGTWSTSTGSTSTGSASTGSTGTWSPSTGSTGTWSSSTGSTSTGSASTRSTGTWSPSTGSTGTWSSSTGSTSIGSASTGSTGTWSPSTGSTGTWSTSTGSTSTGSASTGSTGTWSPSTGSTGTWSSSTGSTSIGSASTGSTGTWSPSTGSTGTWSSSTGSTGTWSSSTGTVSTGSLSTGSTGTWTASTGSASTGSASTGSTGTWSTSTGSTVTWTASTGSSTDQTWSTSTGSTGSTDMSTDSTVSYTSGSTNTDSTVTTSSPSTWTSSTGSTTDNLSTQTGSTGSSLSTMSSTTADLSTVSTDLSSASTVTNPTTDLSSASTVTNPTTDLSSASTVSSPTTDMSTDSSSVASTGSTTTTTTTGVSSSTASGATSTSSAGTTGAPTTTDAPTTTTLAPVQLSSVNMTEVSFTYEGTTPVTQFRCEFDDMISPYKYRVVWSVGGVTVKTSIYDSSMNASTIVLKDYEISSFMLDSQIKCSVEALSSDESTVLISAIESTPFTPVQVQTASVSLQRGSTGQISILNNLYFGCHNDESCSLEFLVYDISDDYSCSDSTIAVIGETTCGKPGTVKNTTDTSGGTILAVPETMNITVITKNDYYYSLKSSFTLKVKVMVTGSSVSRAAWTGEFTQTVSVTVTEPTNLTFTDCSLSSSGRISTFDKHTYTITDSEGEFVLYRHSTYDAEVQVQTKQSATNPSEHYVNGLSVRAGQDVFTISHYGTDHVTSYKSVDGQSSNLIVRKKTSTYYSILLPYGTEVRVKRYPLVNDAMHVVITPSARDVTNLIGLCGNLNDDNSDDYTKRDGSTASTDTDMAGSWGVGSTSSYPTENLFDTSNLASLVSWSDNHKLCVCPGGHTSSEKICGAQEDQTCSGGDISRSGTLISRSTSSRRRRDAEFDMVEYFSEDMYAVNTGIQESGRYNHHVSKRAISLPDALVACESGLNSSCPLFLFDWISSTEERSRIITWCANDMVANDTLDWVLYSCTDLQVLVLALLDKNNVFQNSDPSTASSLMNDNCVGNCSNQGSCVNSVCTCDTDYGGPECTIVKAEPPVVHTTGNNGSVELSVGFTCLDMTTTGATDDAVCKIDVLVGTPSTNGTISFSLSYSVTVSAVVLSYNSIQCCLPNRRRRSTITLNQQYGISTSNNGINFSSTVYTTILDSTCQNITTVNGTTYVLLYAGYCFIDGQCYTEGSVNTASSCQFCTTSYSVFNWNDTCIYPSKDNDDDLEGWAIALIVLSCVGVLVLAAVVAYVFILKKKLAELKTNRQVAPLPFPPPLLDYEVGESSSKVPYWMRRDMDEEKAWN